MAGILCRGWGCGDFSLEVETLIEFQSLGLIRDGTPPHGYVIPINGITLVMYPVISLFRGIYWALKQNGSHRMEISVGFLGYYLLVILCSASSVISDLWRLVSIVSDGCRAGATLIFSSNISKSHRVSALRKTCFCSRSSLIFAIRCCVVIVSSEIGL